MNTTNRAILVVALAVLLAACVGGLSLVYDPDDLRDLIRSARRDEELEQLRRASARHIEAKEKAVKELIFQRCSLRETLVRWQELDREWLQEVERDWPGLVPGILEGHRWNRRDRSEVDFYYECITWRAKGLLLDRPEEAAAVLCRLEKEYQQLRTCQQTSSAISIGRDQKPEVRSQKSKLSH
jgi:hypothetical protein